MNVDEPATKPGDKAARKRRRRQIQWNTREKVFRSWATVLLNEAERDDSQSQGDVSMNMTDQQPRELVQAEEAIEQDIKCLEFQGTASHDLNEQLSAELDCKLAAAPTQKERKTLKARSIKARLTALKMLKRSVYVRDSSVK